MKSLSEIYFSATGTTRKCVETVAAAMGMPVERSLNMADRASAGDVAFSDGDTVVFGAPVYGGRIPALFSEKISRLKGNGARAVAMVVYGNRDYDDALLELTDILRDRGFVVVAAGAFVAQHSIFPKAAASRPDADDIAKLTSFGELCRSAIAKDDAPQLAIKGNRPYKKYGGVPLHPYCDTGKCEKCGVCAALCPTGAIDRQSPDVTDSGKCIACGRCIVSCPSGARRHKGLKYKLVAKIFSAAFSRRKEAEIFV